MENYRDARNHAQKQADSTGFDYGIEKTAFGGWSVFMLPMARNRCGHELRCEVVSCTDLDKCKTGHGPMARRV